MEVQCSTCSSDRWMEQEGEGRRSRSRVLLHCTACTTALASRWWEQRVVEKVEVGGRGRRRRRAREEVWRRRAMEVVERWCLV